MISTWIKRSLGLDPAGNPAATAQAVLMAARESAFYTDLSVPDSFDGRFEMVALHAHLLLRRLRREGEAGGRLGQGVFDHLTSHFDEALREIGVGDMSVGKRTKLMASGLYGRLAAYDAGFDAPEDPAVLTAALRRNLYGTVPDVPAAAVEAMLLYQQCAARHLDAMPLPAIQVGKALFPAVRETVA